MSCYSRRLRAQLSAWLIASLLSSIPLSASAIDVDAGDWIAPAPGSNIFMLYLQHSSQDTQYEDGDVALRDARLDVNLALFRYTHPIKIGRFTVVPQFILPVGRLSAGGALHGLGEETGIGDLILLAPVALVNKPESRTYFWVAPYVFVPIGSYDRSDPLNLGENRWKTALQVAGMTNVADNLSIELTADAMFFGTNDRYTAARRDLDQNTFYQIQGYLNWHWSPKTVYSAGLSQEWGGETEVDHVDQHDRQKTTKFLLTASTFVSQTSQLMFSLGKDIRVESGGKERARINFRYLKAF